MPPWCPCPQYRHLVLNSGTTAGQHDMSSACGSGWCFVRCTQYPHHPLCPIWWLRVLQTWIPLTCAHVLLSAVFNDCLEFSRVLCNRPSSFFRCHPQCPLTPSIPTMAPSLPHPHPQYRYLVIKSGTTAGQHDIWSACGSGWCLVRCTPHSHHPLCPQVEAFGGQEWYKLGSHWPELMLYCLHCSVDHLEFCTVPLPPPLQASSAHEWYYCRSAWHLVRLWVRLMFG